MAADPPSLDAAGPRSVDRAAFDAVFREHHDGLLRLGYLLCSDADRAEDAVAEAFAKVWPHWQAGRVLDERAYLRRALVNELRSKGRRRALEQRVASRANARPLHGGGGDEVVERHRLADALQVLPARQRAAVVLRFYADLSEAETAEALGMRLGTVKSQTNRGLTRLRELLGEEQR